MAAQESPEPRDIYWFNTRVTQVQRNRRRILVESFLGLLYVFYVVPVTLLYLLLSEDSVTSYADWIADLYDDVSAGWGLVVVGGGGAVFFFRCLGRSRTGERVVCGAEVCRFCKGTGLTFFLSCFAPCKSSSCTVRTCRTVSFVHGQVENVSIYFSHDTAIGVFWGITN